MNPAFICNTIAFWHGNCGIYWKNYIKTRLYKSRSSCSKLEFDLTVFHLALSNMVQRHVAFCERHVALRKRHVALLECHVALLIFRQWNAFLNCCYVIFNPPSQAIVNVKNTPVTGVARSHQQYDAIPDSGLCTQHLVITGKFTYLTGSAYTLNWGSWVLKTPNWVPGVHDKVP